MFGRPIPGQWRRWDDPAGHLDLMWVPADESRSDIIDRYRRSGEHADATIADLDIDAPGLVPWWPRPNLKLFNVLVHVLTETHRHAGHADILREQLDGLVGFDKDSVSSAPTYAISGKPTGRPSSSQPRRPTPSNPEPVQNDSNPVRGQLSMAAHQDAPL